MKARRHTRGLSSSDGPARTSQHEPRVSAVAYSIVLGPTDNTAVQFIRYFFVGSAAFAVDFSLLVLLTEVAGFNYLASATIAFICALWLSYALSILWVFNHRVQANRVLELMVFVAVGVVGLVLNVLVMWALTDGVGIHYSISKIVATGLVYVWNFRVRKWLLFRSPALS